MRRRWWLSASLATGCSHSAPSVPEVPVRQVDLSTIFPSPEHMGPGGLSVERAAFAPTETPLPLARLEGREGFSVVQTTVVDLGVELDPSSLPVPFSLGGSVQLWDLTASVELLAQVELDAYPQDEEPPVVLVRPLRPFVSGHEIGVAVTGALRTAAGEPVAVPWFAPPWDAVKGRWPETGPQLEALAQRLDALGVEDLVLATEFVVGGGESALPALDSEAFAQAIAAMEAAPSLRWDEVEVAEQPGDLGDNIWIRARGTLTAPGWLTEEGLLSWDDDGLVQQGDWVADLYVLVPESVRGQGPAPVWQFGHGIFSNPYLYIGDAADNSGVIELAEEAGVVMVATSWPGLSTADAGIALGVSGDFGRFPLLTERLLQGVSNQGLLAHVLTDPAGPLAQDALLADVVDWSAAADGGLRWYGISLGGIAGAVFLAHDPPVDHAVLHVGGAAWSTMLERSDTWSLFEPRFTAAVPSAGDRQRLIALSQLFWDPVDPATYAPRLTGRSLLFQEALGDERVRNQTTELLLRSVNPVVLDPAPVVPLGFAARSEPSLPALVIQDPEVDLPVDENRPPPETGAHEAPRRWATHRAQVRAFLDAAEPGTVLHPCGEEPCSASNSGG